MTKIKYTRCSYCKRIKLADKSISLWQWFKPSDLVDDANDPDNSNVSDGICDDCFKKNMDIINGKATLL